MPQHNVALARKVLDVSRSRYLLDHVTTGHVFRRVGGTVITNKDVIVKDESTCIDDTTPYPHTTPIPCTIDHYTRGSIKCNGQSGPNPLASNFTKIDDYVPDYCAGTSMNHVIPPDLPSAGSDALKVLAYSNPNRGSGSDIGQDLLDGFPGLPGLLKSTGDSILKKGADSHLWWEFGLDPLIEDLKKIYEYQKIFDQRLREFNSLFKHGGLRRKINLGSYSATSEDPSVALQTNYFAVTARRVTTTKVKRWGVVRWYPHGWSLLDYTDIELEARIRRLLYGLDLSPEAIWNKMPWTWLSNWFLTTGLWMKANKSNFPVTPGPVCIMTTYETVLEFKILSKTSWISVSGGSIKHVTKDRAVVPSGGIPFSFFRSDNNFGLGKSSILSSLAIQRLT